MQPIWVNDTKKGRGQVRVLTEDECWRLRGIAAGVQEESVAAVGKTAALDGALAALPACSAIRLESNRSDMFRHRQGLLQAEC